MLENNGWQPARSTLGKSQLTGDRDRFAVLVSGQELLIGERQRFNGAHLRSRRQILQARIGHLRLSPCENDNHTSCSQCACHWSLLAARLKPGPAAAATAKLTIGNTFA